MKEDRPARPFRYQVPTRADTTLIVECLIRGVLTREAVADWASEYILYDEPQIYPRIDDPSVWDALKALMGADLKSTETEFLHSQEDFELWLNDLKAKNKTGR